ncbi:MYG1 family protein [Puniceicoccus vermicola]|uniref:MYG1 family protein n=1 Tax=Puniceicoccus vermicola TaxID=388746 RepID=A0A7X1E826_9BACT|nr:MYG1 family protein [Puniceicoccus vermicola]MBC2604327.1 MYG1 family protein [Puniceicoccus vermicola]
MSIRAIVTHPGGAHKDEFLACAALLAENPVPISRRDPTPENLADPTIAVVDIGHQHDPELCNFDHHQFPRDHVPTCALSLVLQKLDLYEDAQKFCDWLEVVEWFDCRGLKDTAEWLGTDRDTLAKLNSPVDSGILRRFASCTEHQPGEPIWELMRMIGQDMIEYISGLRTRLTFVDQHAEFWTIEGSEESFKALFMPRTDPLPDDPAVGLFRYVQQQGLENEVLAMIYPDSRGTGYGLRRFSDDPRLDFTQIESEPDVHFAHARGFIAKSSADSVERLKELVSAAWIS